MGGGLSSAMVTAATAGEPLTSIVASYVGRWRPVQGVRRERSIRTSAAIAVYVTLLLPPRQSRGTSYGRLGRHSGTGLQILERIRVHPMRPPVILPAGACHWPIGPACYPGSRCR